jgi:uncharacterized Zn-binding protein involved in type VI secretion
VDEMDIFEAVKFAEAQTSQSIADEIGDLFTAENLGKGLDIIGKHLPEDMRKGLPLAQAALGGKLKGLFSGNEGAIGAALGAISKFLPPELAGIIGKAGPLLSKGLGGLLSGKGLGNMLSADGLMGLASQFLPPWAGDAMSAAKSIASGDIAGAIDGLLSKYLPPELKAAYDAIKKASGGLKGLLADLFDKPKLMVAANGFWAARLGDKVQCPGGVGVIDSASENIMIGGQFAARVNDTAACNGIAKSDKILLGEPTIRFGGHFASRITDQTAHLGKIVEGFSTVHLSKSLGQCEGCLTAAGAGGAGAGSGGAGAGAGGAATISGLGITNPFGGEGGLLGGLGDLAKDAMNSPLGDMAKNKLADFAKEKAGSLMGDLIGADKSKVYDGSNFQNPSSQQPMEKKKTDKDVPSLQPKFLDDDDNNNGGIW